jgi:Tol biopolymer transport system component
VDTPVSGPVLEFSGHEAQLSPDGKYLAYVSDVTGRSEVYVRLLLDAQHPTKISDRGGVQPRWRRDGKELFYIWPSTGG